LIGVFKITKDFEVPDKPLSKVPQRKEILVMGTRTSEVLRIDEEKKNNTDELNNQCHETWQDIEDNGEVCVLEQCQHLGERKLDVIFLGKRIKSLSNFDMDEEGGNWNSGGMVVSLRRLRIELGLCLGKEKMLQRRRSIECILECHFRDTEAGRSIEPFLGNKWNKNDVGAWRMDLGVVDYGL